MNWFARPRHEHKTLTLPLIVCMKFVRFVVFDDINASIIY